MQHHDSRPESTSAAAFVKRRRSYRRPGVLDASVLALLQQCSQPVTAYEIAERSQDSPSPLSPTQAYRVLDRLIAEGVVRRVELLSAYVLADDRAIGFRVCRHCQRCQSFIIPSYAQIIDRLQLISGFSVSRSIFEVSGICRGCLGQHSVKTEHTNRQSCRRQILSAIIGAGLMAMEVPADEESLDRSANFAARFDGESRTLSKTGHRRLIAF